MEHQNTWNTILIISFMYKILFFVAFVLFSDMASAYCAQNNNKLDGLVGVDSKDGMVYANLSSPTEECGCTSVRFKESNADTDKVLSILMTAKLSDKKVRVDLLDPEDCNSAQRVYLH